MTKKIASVLELSRYKIGDEVYWLYFAPVKTVENITIEAEDLWMTKVHPKVMFERGPLKPLWPKNLKLPKLHNRDFEIMVNLLNCKIVVDSYFISEVNRSSNTGEFIYQDNNGFMMPESMLFDTEIAAMKERTRLMGLVRKWADN